MTADDLKTPKRRLTAKQERFAQLVAGGDTQADAYRQAYDGSKEPSDALYVQASVLAADVKVALRISVLSERYAAVAELDASYIIDGLKQNAEGARATGDYSPSNKALELLGRQLHGMFQEHLTVDVRVEHALDDATREDLRDMLADLQNQRLALQTSAEIVDAGQTEEDEPEASVLADEERAPLQAGARSLSAKSEIRIFAIGKRVCGTEEDSLAAQRELRVDREVASDEADTN